jgi:hypothetical protein
VADFTIKSGDRLPSIQALLSDADGPINLSTATRVDFIMRPVAGGVPKVNAQATIVSAAGGIVRYEWAAVDTNTPGKYEGEWEVTWNDTKRQTFPTATYHDIEVRADLDDDV